MDISDDDGAVLFDRLQLWIDPVKRPGPEAMAVDEWLLEVAEAPVLRVYGWLGEWGRLGYFGNLAAARDSLPGLDWVRRWTGGGTVDHRADWTYTVVAPAGEPLAKARGAESYRLIHEALESVISAEGIAARISSGDDETGAALCFENPVNHDLVAADGRKLAGAGQRRTRFGLLHQGSVAGVCDSGLSASRASQLASRMAGFWEIRDFLPPAEIIAAKVAARYAQSSWTRRR
jgi:lipoate-protein ligase A